MRSEVFNIFLLKIRRRPSLTPLYSSAASDVYKGQGEDSDVQEFNELDDTGVHRHARARARVSYIIQP